MLPMSVQLVHACAALMLLLGFVFLVERRLRQLVALYQAQGLILCLLSAILAWSQRRPELWWSALTHMGFKVILIPWGLKRWINRLNMRWDREHMVNVPTRLLLGMGLVLLAFNLSHSLRPWAEGDAGQGLSIALACVLLALLMMMVRTQALAQVMGFLAMENAIMFAATASAYGMPMILELGMALDVLVGLAIIGMFMQHMRNQFDSLDLRHIERTRESVR